ncbi:lysosomal-trafficking regulator isoform X2 [Strongylocentrotus purpuratus]|uniref:Lysosomal-trafficking regulator n=1 Tax=Strongylocentrotus purpuratus TaxID=7668 RepID=A0A7M7PQF0_STRPU|nr:lysosomal-trafficking regulator isoform X2 [Strongylocentrotus purpuratus]
METGRGLHQNLKVRWDRYTSCNQETQSEKKSEYLGDFLEHLISMSMNSSIDTEDLYNFCNDVHSTFNILALEFMTSVKDISTKPPAALAAPASMTDFHRTLDSAISSQVSPELPQADLMDFLMHGRGWLLLNAMSILATQALSHHVEFIRLLIALLEEALKVPVKSRPIRDVATLVPPMETCFPAKLNGRRTSQVESPTTMASHLTHDVYRRKTAFLRTTTSYQGGGKLPRTAVGSQRRKSMLPHGREQESTDSENETGRRYRGRHASGNVRKHKVTANYLMAFRNSIPKYQWNGGNLIIRHRMSIDDGLSGMDLSSTTPFDLCITLLSLLEKLCSSEAMNAAHRNSLSLFLAPQLTNLLIKIDHQCSGQGIHLDYNWGPELLGALKRLILRIVLKVCLYSLTQHQKILELSSSGLLQSLLSEAKSSAQKIMHSLSERSKEKEDDFARDEADEPEVSDSVFEGSGEDHGSSHGRDSAKNRFDCDAAGMTYISEILQGVLLLLSYVMYSCHDNQTVLTQGLAMLNEFEENGGYQLFLMVIEAMDGLLSSGEDDGEKVHSIKEIIISLVTCMCKLTTATKKAKLEYLHKFQCLKRTHSNCDYSHYMHHHHSMLGMTYTAFEEDKQGHSDSGHVASGGLMDRNPIRANRSKCCIATVVDVVLELISKVQCRVTLVRLLGMLEQGGICCCIPPHIILSKLLHSIENRSLALSNYLLSVIAKLILEQLRGGEKAEAVPVDLCPECVQLDARHRLTGSQLDMESIADSRTSDSAIGSDGSIQDGDITKSRWQVLGTYANLITSGVNEVLSVQVARHLLHLVKHGNYHIKQELYLHVYLPCFESSRPIGLEESIGLTPRLPYRITSSTVLEYCFSALPILLTSTFAQELFLSQGGLNQLLHLLQLDTTRPHVLQVFEVIILSGDEEKTRRDRSNTTDSGLSAASSVTTASSTSQLRYNNSRCKRDHASTVVSVLDAFTGIVLEVIPEDLHSKSDSSDSSSYHNQSGGLHERSIDRLLSSYDIVDEPFESMTHQSIESVLGTLHEGVPALPERTMSESNSSDSSQTNTMTPTKLFMPQDSISVLPDARLAMASDVWRTCANLIVYSQGFSEHFMQSSVANQIHKILNESFLALAQITKECDVLEISLESLHDTTRNYTDDEINKRDRFHIMLSIVGSLMRIQLKLSKEVAAGKFEGEGMGHILRNVKHHLTESDLLGSSPGRTVADTLLKLAQLEPLDSSQYQIGSLSRNSPKDDGVDGMSWNLEELQEASDDQSSELSDLWSAEGGYEADSERDEREDALTNNKPDREDLIFAQSQQSLVYPEVCQLMLEVLSTTDGCARKKVLYFLLNQLISLVKGNESCKASLNQCGVPTIILEGYQTILQQDDKETSVERALLLELFSELVENSITSSQLRGYLTLFQSPSSPMSCLLSTLLTIASSAVTQPATAITFPVMPEPSTRPNTPLPMKVELSSTPEVSAWNASATHLPLRNNIMWTVPLSKGVGVAMWLKTEERRKGEFGEKMKKSKTRTRYLPHSSSASSISSLNRNPLSSQSKSGLKGHQFDLHLVTLGTRDMTFEVWLESKTSKLIFRIGQSSNDHQRTVLLAETACAGMLTSGQWEHLVVTYHERKDDSMVLGMISVIVNGHHRKDVMVDYNYSSVMVKIAQQPMLCLIGHCLTNGQTQGHDAKPQGAWSLGHMHIFNDASALQKEAAAFHLFSMGPDLYALSQCEGSKRTRLYSRQITKDIMIAGIKPDILFGDREIDEKLLRESLVATYSASSPSSFSLYQSTSPGTLSKVLPGKIIPPSLLHSPTLMQAIQQAHPIVRHHMGLHKAVYQVGGISVFVFLFAKVVETSSDGHQQARALQLLMQLQNSSYEMAQEFRSISGPLMLSKVLASERCHVGPEMLKVLFDACCSESVVFQCSLLHHYKVNEESTAILQDTEFFTQLLLNWRVWDRATKGAWRILLEGILALIRHDHPFYSFNINQMQRVGLVQKLFTICRERHSEDLPALPVDSYSSLIEIIKTMVGIPADPHLMAEISDFLLAVHPAVNTFVCHAPSSFFFILHKGKWYKSRSSTPSEISSHDMDDVRRHDFKLGLPPVSREEMMKKKNSVKYQSPVEHSDGDKAVSIQNAVNNPPSQEEVHTPRKDAEEDVNVGGGGDEVDGGRTLKSSHHKKRTPKDSTDGRHYGRERRRRSSSDSSSTDTSDEISSSPSSSTSGESEILSSGDEQRKEEEEEEEAGLGHKACHINGDEEGGEGIDDDVGEDDAGPGVKRKSPTVRERRTQSVNFAGMQLAAIPEDASMDLSQREDDIATSPSDEDFLSESKDRSSGDKTTMVEDDGNLAVSSFDSLDASSRDITLNRLCSGLLDLLAECLIFISESKLDKVLGIVLKPETLIVLAHHHSEEIRTSVVKLLDVYFHRANEAQLSSFLRMQGFHQLANQLHQYPATQELAEACLTITFGKPVDLNEELDLALIQDLPRFRQLSVVLICSLMENSTHDAKLCHSILCAVLHLFEGGPQLVPALLENGLLEATTNTLASLCTTSMEDLDYEWKNWSLTVLLDDVRHIIACIANRVFSLSGDQYLQYLEDMLTLLGGLEEMFQHNYGTQSAACRLVCNVQCHVIREVLEHFQSTSKAMDSSLSAGPRSGSLQRSISYSERQYDAYTWRERMKSLGDNPEAADIHSKSRDQPYTNDPIWDYRRPRTSVPSVHGDHSYSFTGLLPPSAAARRYSSNLDSLLRSRRGDGVRGAGSGRGGNRDGGQATEQEMARRFQRLCLLAVNLVVNSDLTQPGSSPAIQLTDDLPTLLTKDLFHLLIEAMGATMEKKVVSIRRRRFDSIVWSSRQTLQLQLARLLVHMMSPAQDLTLRIFTLQVAHVDKSRQILKCVLQTSMQQYASKLELYLYDLLHNHREDMSDTDRMFGMILGDVLKECGFQSFNPDEDDPQAIKSLEEDLRTSWTDIDIARSAWHKHRLDKATRLNQRLSDIAREITHSAMEVTQVVGKYQNKQRFQFLEHIKQAMSSALDVRTAWQHLIEQLTHERAVWFDPETYPSRWQLDPTEGPGRVRRRLQRCHLLIPKKFFLPDEQTKHREMCSRPLAYLFDSSSQSQSSSELKRRLQMNEKISLSSTCVNVTPATETRGELLLGNNSMYFVGEEPLKNTIDASHTKVSMGDTDLMTIWWTYTEIKELHLRWYQLRDNALEIFLTNGKTLLLGFDNTEERQTIFQQIKSMDLPNLIEVDSVLALTQAWRLGQMTNFEYLTQLNKLGGRSFNDLMQYPVFPFVLNNYIDEKIDLTTEKCFRDLTKPVAVQNKDRVERYMENYKALLEEYDKNHRMGEEASTLVIGPYHYGSHYSNSGTVLQYLVRLPPFTQMFLHYQDNHFDLPDRTFHSIQTSWFLSSFQSTTDVKELIPEFFFLPEFLLNNQGYDFGCRQSGETVHNVILPPWAKDDARLFVQIMKQALESTYVTQKLHSWVDLVFGYKQLGQHAVDAINVFHPATYFGRDTRTIKDNTKRRAVETMIKTYGQTPKQLFTNPHPQHNDPDPVIVDSAMMGSVNMGFLTSFTSRSKGSLSSDKGTFREPVSHVKGMRWGDYLGSPASSEPMVKWQQAFMTAPNQLIPLPTGNVCGVAENQCLLVMYSKEKSVSSMYAVDIKWSGFLTWGHSDGILRLKHKAKTPPINFLQSNTNDEITSCSSVSDCRLMFTGMASGMIIAYNIKFNQYKQSSIEVTRSVVRLLGHTGPVTCLYVCRPYSILVSASQDGTCIIWDLNRLCYVRSLKDETKRGGSITAVAVSEVSGDIASASDVAAGVSELTLWSINADLIGRVFCHSRMLCLSFSTAPEGISINAIAAGCYDGIVRMWSTLDLSPLRNISPEMHQPITSLTFSHDSHFLFTCDEDGLVIAWGKKDTNKKVPKFEAFLNAPRNSGSSSNLEASMSSQR